MVQVQVVSDVVTVLLACWHSANLKQCREFAYSCTLVMRSDFDAHGCDCQTMDYMFLKMMTFEPSVIIVGRFAINIPLDWVANSKSLQLQLS